MSLQLHGTSIRLATSIVLLLLAAGSAAGQENADRNAERLVVPKVQGAIELDGRLDEPAWAAAHLLPQVQMTPDFGIAPSERTEILIAYDDEYLYVACRCYDSGEPSAPSFRRDYNTKDTDFVGVRLDTFNDKENVVSFFTTPTGLRMDAAVYDDASSPAAYDFDWNSVWDAAARQTDEGWFAELRIPLSSLGFTAEGDQVVMGLIAGRWLARLNEETVFPRIAPEWGTASSWKASQAREVVFEDVAAPRLLRITPYALGGAAQQSVLDESGTAYQRETDPAYEAGVDIKYGLGSNFTLDLTVNTDFAQVEADNQQVNLTRFPLFFPEKRRFFQERSSTFAFDFGGQDRLFYTRRIGLHEGESVRILGGARVVGRSGPWDIGVLNMQTGSERLEGEQAATLPSENLGVVRLRRQAWNPYSYVGAIVTSRVDTDGGYSLAYGLDGIFRVTGDEYVTARWAQTFEDASANRVASLDPSRVLLRWERRGYRGLGYDLRYERSGARYAPALGFELREDYVRLGDRIGYGWIPGEEDSRFERHRLSVVTETFFRNADGSVQTLEIGPEWDFRTASGHGLTVGARRWVEDLRTPFTLSGEAQVPEGRHTFGDASVSYTMPTGRRLRADAGLTAGTFYDGRRLTARVSPTWNASRYVRLSGHYQLDRVDFPDRDEAFRSHLGRVRLEVTPNVRYSVQAFVQYNSASAAMAGNVRFRYNPREGNDLYLVYNEGITTDRDHLRPRPPLSTGRTLLLKYTYTLGW